MKRWKRPTSFHFPIEPPRYTPGIPLDGPSVGAGVAADTNEVPDASRVTPPVLLPGFPNPVQLSLEVQLDLGGSTDDNESLASQIRSSLHSTITEGAGPWTIRLQPGERLNRDFILRYPVQRNIVGTSLTASPPSKQKPGVFGLTLFPPSLDEAEASKPRDVVFVIDRSGSMSGWKMVAARRALGRMIDTLLDHDRFGVIAFDNTLEQPPNTNKKLASGNNRERWRALEWLRGIDARGGTEMRPALTAAAKLLASDRRSGPHREKVLVIVTDGQVTGENAILKELSKQTGGAPPRLHTVGIDRAVNAAFLKRLADFGGGSCELVESKERLDEAMDRIHRLIGTPVLTNVQITSSDGGLVKGSVSPGRPPDLFAGRPVTIFGRYKSKGDDLRLRIGATTASGQKWCDEVTAEAAPADMLTSLWGRAKVRDLEDQYAAAGWGPTKKLMQQIVEVSLESNVLSRFTAYVAVDRSEIVNEGGRQTKVVQPVESPEGWDMLDDGSDLLMVPCSAPAGARMRGKMRKLSRRATSQPPEDTAQAFMASDLDSADSLLCEFEQTAIDFTETDMEYDPSTETDPPSPVIERLLKLLIEDADQQNATEIRIEPKKRNFKVRYRIKRKLVGRYQPPFQLLAPLIVYIKRLAGLDETVTDRPQQGRLTITVANHEVTLDVVITPTKHGESVELTFVRDPSRRETLPRGGGKRSKRDRFWA